MPSSLSPYWKKRNFGITSEPRGEVARPGKALSFVIQKHAATRLHYDFRLELDGTLKSWAVPKGPSYDPKVRRMAVHVEDHPLSYASFEGVIPKGQYGAGTVIVWDRGTWEPIGDPREGYRNGKLKFEMHGEKMRGRWNLVRINARKDERQEPWLLIKETDDEARPASDYDVTEALPDSVLAGVAKDKPKKKSTGAARKKAPSRSKQPASIDSSAIPSGARAAKLPLALFPQLATLVDEAPTGDGWIYELKFDGYRIVARIDGDDVRLFTRNGNNWTVRLKALAEEVRQLGIASAWLDGEIVVLNSKGIPDFQLLQNAFDSSKTRDIVYFVFDLPHFGGYDLTRVPLVERRQLLAKVLESNASPHVRFSEAFDLPASRLLEGACKQGLEGLIGKRSDAPYTSTRSAAWVKIKCSKRQEFVVAGFTDPKGSRIGFGSLLLGVHDAEGRLRFAGSVGTGFDDAGLRELYARLKSLETDKDPFFERRRDVKGHWVKPRLVAEVAFTEWTGDGRIRHPVFHGLRTDKDPEAITREEEKPVEEAEEVTAKETTAKATTAKATITKKAATKKPSAKKAAAKKPIATRAIATQTTATEKTASAKAPQHKTAKSRARPAKETNAGDAPSIAIKITHGERVVDPSTQATKLDLVRYYESIAEHMLPHLAGRPIALVRAPTGIGGELFFQKHGEKIRIPGIRQLDRSFWPGHPAMLEVATKETLVGAAQMNVIEFHTWNSTTDDIAHPDRVIFDLDPGEGVDWATLKEATALMKKMLDMLGLTSFLKTSGGKGLHAVVPLSPSPGWGYDDVKDLAEAIVQHMARTIPKLFVAKSGAQNRIGRIFIDYLRNGKGATTIAAFSARARPGLGVSVPCAWKELPGLEAANQWNIANVHQRLAKLRSDPWKGYASARQTLDEAAEKLGFRRK
ncbi:MAG TPA: non-homologous end-joining DNA ligase [Usitatibacter sp.]|nr:non-homologous end-joining DNA ligase [Usitatibacter sp.]